ncbi:hypothetical protein MTO96_014126 [Rhipicephalus appendiculatus]
MWYDSLLSVHKTWPEWKVELKRAFPSTAGMQRLHREMEDIIYKRGEPIECYYYEKLAKARRCNLSEEACIEYLITGLNNQDTIRAISTRTYDSPEELLRCLKRLEERVGIFGSRDSKHSKASEFQNLAGHRNQENRAAETALNENQQNQQNSEPKRETEPYEPRRETPLFRERGPRCFNCNKYGHLSTARVRSGGRGAAFATEVDTKPRTVGKGRAGSTSFKALWVLATVQRTRPTKSTSCWRRLTGTK